MKRWQIFLFSIMAVAIIGGAGYLGFQGTNPFAQAETPEPVEVPPTVAVTRGEVQQTIIMEQASVLIAIKLAHSLRFLSNTDTRRPLATPQISMQKVRGFQSAHLLCT